MKLSRKIIEFLAAPKISVSIDDKNKLIHVFSRTFELVLFQKIKKLTITSFFPFDSMPCLLEFLL